MLGIAKGIGAKGLERGSGRLAERRVQFLDGAERLAEPGAHGGGRLVEGGEDMVFIGGLGLLAGDRVSGRG